MKSLFTNIVLFVALLWSATTFAQTVVQVPPGNGTLNQAIQDYIDNNGSVDQSVVFELEDGGIYILSATIDFDFPLNIQAAPNSMVRPAIQPIPANGGETFRAFRIRESVILKGLYITTEDALGGRSDQIIRVSNDGARVEIDNCHLDKAAQSALRIDNDNNKIYITNTIISNIINLQNPSNGRAIDDRGQDIDTLWVENSTIYNLTARILRDDGGLINWLRWNHTTCVNTGDRTLDIGEGLEVEVKNNLFINPAFLGDDDPDATAFQIDLSEDEVQDVTISHNNFYADPALEAIYDAINVDADPGDSVYVRGFINGPASDFIEAGGFTNTITFIEPMFANAPATPTDYVSSFYDDPANAQPLDDGDGGIGPGLIQLPFDFALMNDSPLVTGGDNGQQLGDLNWGTFPTSTQELDPNTIQFQLFPNPVADVVQLQFVLDEAAPVQTVIFDALGRTLLARQEQAPAGPIHQQFDLSNLPQGYYFAKLTIGDRFLTAKIVK
ncbi:MAG: T9SS type A sorting domain-containing protein [Bacteroidota bacterium]